MIVWGTSRVLETFYVLGSAPHVIMFSSAKGSQTRNIASLFYFIRSSQTYHLNSKPIFPHTSGGSFP